MKLLEGLAADACGNQMTGACNDPNPEMTVPAVLFALIIFGQPLTEDHRMGEWYSLQLEGLAAQL